MTMKVPTDEMIQQTALFSKIKLESLAEHIEKYECPELGNLLVALQWHARRFESGEFDSMIKEHVTKKLNQIHA